MEFIGSMRQHGEGWDLDRLLYAKGILETIFEKTVDLYNLNELCLEGVTIPEKCEAPKPAYLMVVRNFLTNSVHENFKKDPPKNRILLSKTAKDFNAAQSAHKEKCTRFI